MITVGSTAGLEAARRGECDVAGVHLLDARTGEYNRPFLTDELVLVEGYGRLYVKNRAAKAYEREIKAMVERLKPSTP